MFEESKKDYYNSLSLKDKPKFIYSLFQKGYNSFEIVHMGIPRTSVRRTYDKFSKNTGIIDSNRFDEKERIINGVLFKQIGIPGFERYMSDNKGDIISIRNGSFISSNPDKDGYRRIGLYSTIDNKRHHLGVHKIVLSTFGPKPPKDMINPVPDHINGIVDDNRIENLRWLSNSDNSSKEFKHNDNGYRIPENTIKEICERLQNGENRWEISKITGIDVGSINNILYRKYHTDISKNYKFKIYEQPKRINTITQKEIFEGYFPNDNNTTALMRVLKIAPQTINLIRKMIYLWKENEIDINTKPNPDLPGYTDWI